MGPIGCPETSLRNYRCTLRNNPEERRTRQLRGGSLKSRTALPARGIFSYHCALDDVKTSREYSRLWLHAHRSRGRVGWVRSVALQWTGCEGSVHPRPGCWVWAATCKTGQDGVKMTAGHTVRLLRYPSVRSLTSVLSSFVWILHWHAFGRPTYRPKHIAHIISPFIYQHFRTTLCVPNHISGTSQKAFRCLLTPSSGSPV